MTGPKFGEGYTSVEQLRQKYQNNRAKNSHHPTRLREKVMRRFKSRATRNVFSQPSGSLPQTGETTVQS
jgi:transposase-like protein